MQLTQMNLQQVPARSEYGKLIRQGFIAPKGHVMLVCDYSMFELVMMAIFCNDPRMTAVLGSPKGDLHQQTADLVGVSRSVAKTLNFGLLYGMGPGKLKDTLAMQGINVSMNEARSYIRNFFKAYLYIDIFKDNLLNFARQNGYLKYLSGRVRTVPDINSTDGMARSKAEREVVNNIIQGSCADWIKQAMLRIQEDTMLRKAGAKMIMQIHDELVFYVPDRGKVANHSVLSRVVYLMRQPVSKPIIPISIPVRVGSGLASNWGEAK